MVDQTTLNGRRGQPSAMQGVRGNAASLAHDLLALAELQVQLLAVDVRDSWRRMLRPAALAVGGVVLGLGAVPVILIGVSRLLSEHAALSQTSALLFTGSIAVLIACVLAWLGWRGLQTAAGVLKRSQSELVENIDSIKSALHHWEM